MAKHQLKTNIIYCGDNLKILPEIPDESVDLIYIDPPFNSNRNYEVFWGDIQEKRAFDDRFGNAQHYIDWMRPRVLELYRVLKNTGSFFYHCDWHASHYVKIMLDQIFNFNNFRNEIIWNYEESGLGTIRSSSYPSKHDTIFWYSKGNKYTYNPQLRDYKPEYKVLYVKKDEKGFYREKWRYHTDGSGYKVKQYMKEGVPFSDVWNIESLTGPKKERLGYPTQKPLELLERIVLTASNKDDVVLDSFCGCGTTLVAAQKHKRKWVGIDISPTACRVMSQRLWDIFKIEENKDFTLSDLPKTEEELLQLPPFEFQNWAVIALGGIPNRIKVGDYGIDGKLYPIEQERKKQEGKGLFGDIDIYYPIQVKQKDKVGRPDIDNFETAIRRDKRNRGYFIAFGFTEDAIKEIKRLDKEEDIEIRPIAVKELLKHESGLT